MYLNEYDVQGRVPVVVQLLIIGNVPLISLTGDNCSLWYYG